VIFETSRVEFPTEAGKIEGIIQGGGPVPGAQGTLSHYWKYKVTDSKVEMLEDGGDFSPEHVE